MAYLERVDKNAVAYLTLNQPDKLNPLSNAMLAALSDEIARLAEDRAIRVVVIAGAGRAFCAGHDLKEMTTARDADDNGRAAFADLFERCSMMMQSLQRLPQPVIAQVHGLAAAAGCQLVATCDMAVAAESTRFGVNGVNIGLFCSTPMVALTRNIPRKHAFEMLTTGAFIDATRARELGLVNRVAPDDQLEAETQNLAETVAAKLATAVRIGKEAFYAQAQMPLDEAYRYTGDVMVANMLDRDTEEGIQAFLEKRAPAWSQDGSDP
ncbi:putative enoyl-CoA hydratase echA8 [Roseivivax sp. THAF40]|uniref:enoyl-CoA hydratase n=1 Tax=unclassified Roseivivax TaxID=2639302 RepID=UPI001267F18A|nr:MULTISPECIES: enoyl-CoA hydratase [unclassified Roseivivax]QFS82265.1 putative enoyl-CoA hydratase echA8 [Roseivivax sp. THAF197b]QFT46065.1 putative enoyl-CoA hydratase echA8 [Roseivivax sp. THAF40]